MSTVERRRTTGVIVEEIRRELDAADVDFRSGVQHAIRAGELLLEAKERVVHGRWLSWVAENVPLSVRHTQRLMQLAANAPSVAHLETINEAVAVLAEPKGLPAPADADSTSEVEAEPDEPPPDIDGDVNLLGEPVLSMATRGGAEPEEPEELPVPRQLKDPATDKQLSYLAGLHQERGLEVPTGPISRTRASKVIDEMLGKPVRLKAGPWLKRLRSLVEEVEAAAPVGGEFAAAQAYVGRLARVVGGVTDPTATYTATPGVERSDEELQALYDASEASE